MKLLVMMDAKWVTGPARQLLAVTPLLAERGIQTEFVLASRGEGATPYSLALEELGCPVHRMVDRFAGDFRLLSQFRDVLRKARPDLLQTHGYRSNTLARLSRKTAGCPWIAFFHGVTWENLKVQIYNRIDVWAMSKANRVVTVSQAQAMLLQKKLPRETPVAVIPNAVLLSPSEWTPSERQKERAKLGVGEGAKLLGVFGRLSHEKGQDLFLTALSQVVEQSPNLFAILLGDGPLRSRLEEQINNLRLQEHVRMLGHQANVARYYALLDALVLPSRSEGMPNVLLEAMSLKVPVVAANVGGVTEVACHEQDALIVAPEDPAELARAILRMLNDSALRERMVASASERVSKEFSLPARVEQLLRMYEG